MPLFDRNKPLKLREELHELKGKVMEAEETRLKLVCDKLLKLTKEGLLKCEEHGIDREKLKLVMKDVLDPEKFPRLVCLEKDELLKHEKGT